MDLANLTTNVFYAFSARAILGGGVGFGLVRPNMFNLPMALDCLKIFSLVNGISAGIRVLLLVSQGYRLE